MKSIAKFALWGALGFGVGGAGTIGGRIRFWGASSPFGPAIMGGIGGAVLGVALKRWRRSGLMALAGLIGFAVGSVVTLIMGLMLVDPFGPYVAEVRLELLLIAIRGAIGGAAVGLAFKGWKGTWLPSLTGAVGFGAGFGVYALLGPIDYWEVFGELSRTVVPVIMAAIRLIPGVVGGAFLGAAIGYLEKRKAD